MLFDTPLNQINESVLQSLVGTVPEGRQIEYKFRLPGNSDQDIVEFLKDVTAMANTLGGDILYGVREDKNASGSTLAMAIEGISGEDADKVKQRLESFIRNSVKLRLIGHQIELINLVNGNQVFIVRVPRSWNAPHVVEYQKHWRFYYRNSAGSHPMDVTELRHAFTLADTLSQRLEEFRLERLAKIASDEKIGTGARVVLHIQPFSSVSPTARIDFIQAKRIDHYPFISENYGGFNRRINYLGFFEYMDWSGQRNYLQLFRTGKLEAVSGDLFNDGFIPEPSFEARLLEATYNYLALLKKLDVNAPLMLHLSLLRVKGYKIKSNSILAGATPDRTPIDEDDLLLPGEIIENFGEQPAQILRNSFDAIWNAAGMNRSPNYDENGNWSAQ